MKKITMLSINSFKKNFKHIFSFSIILLISTILFSSAIVIKNNIDKDYNEKHKALNTANIFFTIPKIQYSDELFEKVKNIKGIKEIETENGIMLTIPVKMNESTQEQNQIFYKIDEKSNINKYNIIDECNKNIKNPIYISYYIYKNSGLKLEDKYEFKVNDENYLFEIKGIIEEMQYGNYSSSVIGNYLNNESYDYLLKENEEKEVITLSATTEDTYKTYNEVSKILTKNNISILNKNYDEASKQARLSVSNILVLIILAFSIVMLFISILVSKFKIKNSIEEEITNMGVLKAFGYSSNEIILGTIFPFIFVSIIITAIGIALSYFVIPFLADIISSQAGFIWNPKFDINSSIIIAIINISLIAFFCFTSAIKIKKLNPINAIRGIAQSTNSKNYFRIDKTKGNINLILALKNFAYTKSQNLLLGIVLLFVTILAGFVIMLFYNVNINPINFVNTLVEEHPTVVAVSEEKNIKEEINKLNEVKKAIYYDESGLVEFEENSFKTFVSESYDNLANNLCYQGKNPTSDNEIAVGSFIKEKYDLKIGDEITLSKNSKSYTYKITGFVQSVNYSGEVIEITIDGYKKLDVEYNPKSIYIYLNNENEASSFIREIEDIYGNKINSIVNYVESMDSAVNMFISLIKIITIIIIAISLVVIYLILYILISSIIAKRKQELGILKSEGYINRQLIYQIVGGFMPSTIIATMIGVIVNKLLVSKIFDFIFKMVGAYKVSFEYPLFIFVLIGIALVISTIMIGILLSKRIKKISVYSLIKE